MTATDPLKNDPTRKNGWLKLLLQKEIVRQKK